MDLDSIHELAQDPEYSSIKEFVQFMKDDERTEYDHVELRALALNAHRSAGKLRSDLLTLGLTLAPRKPQKRTRGFTTSSHDRWYGPGACKSHGGSGHEQIRGFAGRVG